MENLKYIEFVVNTNFVDYYICVEPPVDPASVPQDPPEHLRSEQQLFEKQSFRAPNPTKT